VDALSHSGVYLRMQVMSSNPIQGRKVSARSAEERNCEIKQGRREIRVGFTSGIVMQAFERCHEATLALRAVSSPRSCCSRALVKLSVMSTSSRRALSFLCGCSTCTGVGERRGEVVVNTELWEEGLRSTQGCGGRG